MKTYKDFPQLIDNANEDDLRDIVNGWAETHSEFKSYVEQCLCPSIGEVDFSHKLSQAVSHETKEFFSRHDIREATDWSNVYYDLIKPWSDSADTLPTEKLYDLIAVIVSEVGMQVTDEDFYGDDWYGDDFSGNIQDIMDVLGNLVGLLLVRDNLTPEILGSLIKLVETAQTKDVIDCYIDSPYDTIFELIRLRQDTGEVTCAIFDRMIEENFEDEAGKWVCRKIDFIRSMGLADEAQKYMEDKFQYPAVCLKYYNELMDSGRWQDAIKFLDKTQSIKDTHQAYFKTDAPNWLELKQQILIEHGTLEERIENLQRLFHNSYSDKAKYYHQLKEMVGSEEWNTFYHKLLSDVSAYDTINKIAPFLIEEGEFEWLFRLVSEEEKKDSTDYRTPLKYAEILRLTHFGKMQAALVRTIRAYAADRFPPKKKVNPSKYSYFRTNLESMSDMGYAEVQKELVEYLLEEYRFRPALVKELRSIKLI